jgi:hypothetical protein
VAFIGVPTLDNPWPFLDPTPLGGGAAQRAGDRRRHDDERPQTPDAGLARLPGRIAVLPLLIRLP